MKVLSNFIESLKCKHRSITFVKAFEKEVGHDGNIMSLVKCLKCGKYVQKSYSPVHIISGLIIDKNKAGYVGVKINDNWVYVTVAVLMKNICIGLWFVSEKVINDSVLYAQSKLRGNKVEVANKEYENFDIQGASIRKLLKGTTVTLSLAQGKLFLQGLSLNYGYENARKRWSWERDENNDVMIFKTREVKR